MGQPTVKIKSEIIPLLVIYDSVLINGERAIYLGEGLFKFVSAKEFKVMKRGLIEVVNLNDVKIYSTLERHIDEEGNQYDLVNNSGAFFYEIID